MLCYAMLCCVVCLCVRTCVCGWCVAPADPAPSPPVRDTGLFPMGASFTPYTELEEVPITTSGVLLISVHVLLHDKYIIWHVLTYSI